MNSYGGYFLVRGGDKKSGEYKNKNWVKILRSDSYERAKIFLVRKNGKKWGNIRTKIGSKMVKNG